MVVPERARTTRDVLLQRDRVCRRNGTQVVDFGLCCTGSAFHRVINVLNVGNIGCVTCTSDHGFVSVCSRLLRRCACRYTFEITPDPTDTDLLFGNQISQALKGAVKRIRGKKKQTSESPALAPDEDVSKPPLVPFAPPASDRKGSLLYVQQLSRHTRRR